MIEIRLSKGNFDKGSGWLHPSFRTPQIKHLGNLMKFELEYTAC